MGRDAQVVRLITLDSEDTALLPKAVSARLDFNPGLEPSRTAGPVRFTSSNRVKGKAMARERSQV